MQSIGQNTWQLFALCQAAIAWRERRTVKGDAHAAGRKRAQVVVALYEKIESPQL
jgi:hypothetical protein